MDTLRNAQEELRDKHVLDFDARSVTGITLAAPNQPELHPAARCAPGAAKEGEVGNEPHWQIVLPGDGNQGPRTLAADTAAVQRLLEQLALLSAIRFQSDAPQASDLENWGFNRPERTITLTSPPNAPILLQIGLPTHRDGAAYALVANAPYKSVYAVSQDILAETPVTPGPWRERLLRAVPAGARIVALRLTDLSTNSAILDWKPGNVLGAAQQAALQTVIDRLRTLRAQRIMEDAFTEKVNIDGEERPWKYRLDATIALPGAEQTGVSSLWPAGSHGGGRTMGGIARVQGGFSTRTAPARCAVDAHRRRESRRTAAARRRT